MNSDMLNHSGSGMDPSERGELARAGEFIRTTIATDADRNPLSHIRFAERLARHTERRRHRRRLAAIGSACVIAVGAVFVSVAMQPQVLTYRVDNAAELGTLGSYVSAPAQAPLSLRFSEGSHVVLQPRARGRVSQTSRHGATMVLEDGQAHAEIVHRDQTDWRVLAGPFVVGVTGTSFDVAFDVATQTFELKMESGKVRVTGPGLKAPVDVGGSQRLVLSAKTGDALAAHVEAAPQPVAPDCAASAFADARAPNPTIEAVPPGVSRASGSAGVPGSSIAPPLQRNPAVSEPVGESFGQLGARGKHQRIVELAEKQGFDSAIAAASRSDLLALGNAARFAGRANLATMAYRAVRERFSATTEAAAAAFYLGRLSESSNPSGAMSWYERYVAEAPNGVWAADALGRRLALMNELRAGPAVNAAAKDYLERFPSGPYAGFARKILAP